MSSDSTQTYIWYPTANGGETQQQREENIARTWFQENLPAQVRQEWIRRTSRFRLSIKRPEAIRTICKFDSSELVELLYPRFPELFHKSFNYTLSHDLFASICESEGPFSEEVLQQCLHARIACLNPTCLFALAGASSCLEVMLELGADPDGLDTPDSWSYIKLPNDRILPVSPMDCALLGDNEDCQLILELYGGKTLHEHLSDS